ncbi:MAG: hypothetical protein ACK4QW_13105 [Alphaproteobacteria bacterium]
MGTLLATDPALLDTVSAAERRRAHTILDELMPIGLRGMLNDAVMAGAPTFEIIPEVRLRSTSRWSKMAEREAPAANSLKACATIPSHAVA